MLSSRINSNAGDNDDHEGESTMPGDYEPWKRAASRIGPSRPPREPRPIIPPMPRPGRRPTIAPQTVAPKTRPSVKPAISPVRPHRTRRRSLTPEIVIEKRHHHHHHHHSSSRKHRVFTISLDNRPTLGLRGPPKRVLEIERVPCRRRRKHRSPCYEIDYDIPPPQSNIIVANPIPDPCLSAAHSSSSIPANNSAASLALLSNLTPEMIQNLPRQTVYLPPIHFPGSQADANTGLNTVIFPAEIINPIDGTLSIIQSASAASSFGNANVQFPVLAPTQPQVISASTNVESPLSMLATASGPFMQQLQDLLQRTTLSLPQQASSPFNNAIILPSLPGTTQYNAANNSFYNPQSLPPIHTINRGPYPRANIQPTSMPNSGLYNAQNIPPIHTINRGPYPTANIQPTNTPNSRPYNPTTFTPSTLANAIPYRQANVTSYQPTSTTPYRQANVTSYQPTSTTPYRPANIRSYQLDNTTSYNAANVTPYNPANIRPYRPANIRSYQLDNTTSYNAANVTPYNPANIRPYRPANIRSYQLDNTTSYNAANVTPYNPANIRPYQATTFTPSNPTNTGSYFSTRNTPSNSSNIGPYRPANITPYGAGPNRYGGSSLLPPSIPSASLASSDSFSSFPSGIGNRPLNIPHSSQSQSKSQTPYQSGISMPKSILRNAPPNTLLNTTYTRSNPPNVSFPDGIVRDTSEVF